MATVAVDPRTDYLLRLGDDALVLGQRVSEWCGHGPVLEVDISLANLSLDLIGQATLLLGEAGELFEPAESKIYRHPTFYDIPDEVKHI